MIIYRDATFEIEPQAALASFAGLLSRIKAGDRGSATELLIRYGELESALVDAERPASDRRTPTSDLLGEAALAIGRVFCASIPETGGRTGAARAALDGVARTSLPARTVIKVAEGYAYYGLFPQCYRAATSLLPAASHATVIGLRSIGTSLSAVVAATLEERGCRVSRITLRPSGQAFDRKPVLHPDLACELEAAPGLMIIVDEGPGLSGSSFCGTADVLLRLGIARERIWFMPSHDPDPGTLENEHAQSAWWGFRRALVPFEQSGLLDETLPGLRVDISAGRWRERVWSRRSDWPAADPRHERRKYLYGLGQRSLAKFVGLARTDRRLALVEGLAEAGFSPPPHGIRDGFIVQPFVTGRPAISGEDLAGRAADYVAFRARHFAQGGSAIALDEMLRENAREVTGTEVPDALCSVLRETAHTRAPIWLDGRMMPHEWLMTPDGVLKTDAIDHGDDHFLPGPQDAAWDVAGFAVEFGLDDDKEREFVDLVSVRTTDRQLKGIYPAFRAAYLAFRAGYTRMSTRALHGSADGARLAAQSARYAAMLDAALRPFAPYSASAGRCYRNRG